MSSDIYQTRKSLENYKKRIREASDLPQESKDSLLAFFDYATANGLSQSRVLIYAQKLHPIARALGKPFKEASKQDLQAVMAEIESNPRFTEWTKYTYKTVLKRFYKWLEGNDEAYPDKIKWVKARVNNRTNLLPEELLTRDDVLKLVDAAENPRDKALISVLYDSGCRVGEVANLQFKHVTFDKNGAQIMVQGKTGQRRVRLIESFHNLSYWLENHPWKSNRESFVWVLLTGKKRGQRMNYASITRQLHKIAKAAGVSKPVNPHAFRHARATQLARMGLNEASLNAFFGWTQGSQMARTYLHLSGQDTDNALLKAYGLVEAEDQQERLACARCQKLNDVNARFCKDCGMPLSTVMAVEQESEVAKLEKKLELVLPLLNDPAVKETIVSKLANQAISADVIP